MIDILLVCTGNTCRSPMAEVLLARHLAERGVNDARVHSAGTLPWAGPATHGARTAVAERGLDLSSHASRPLDAELLAGADVVLGMTRDHVGRVLAVDADARRRTFLLGELVRLGRHVGPRAAEEPVADWLDAVAARRPHGRPPGRAHDEVADPAGEPVEVYRRTAAHLDRLTSALADLLAGTGARTVESEGRTP